MSERHAGVVGLACAEAARLGYDHVGTEHLLLGLLDARECGAFRILRRLGVDPARLRAALEEGSQPRGSAADAAAAQLPLAPEAKQALEAALAEATTLGSATVGTEHLLLALARGGGRVSGVLQELAVGPDRVRAAIVAALAECSTGDAGEPSRNLEVKARCDDLERMRAAAVAHGARRASLQRQTDTYFHAPRGRLKLREVEGIHAELIAYERPDIDAPRVSSYRVIPLPSGTTLREALSLALGVRGVVTKCREIYLWRNVRIHFDEVTGLGSFVELEGVMGDTASEEATAARVAELARVLGIRAEDRIATSYVDLLGG